MNKKYYTIEFIKKSFQKKGYILLSKEYKAPHDYLEFICPIGHQHKMTWNNWRNGRKCGKCHYITYRKIKQSFENEGYQLLSTEYLGAHKYLDFICPNGHKHKIIWGNWTQGHRCGKCAGTAKLSYEFVKQSFEDEGYQLLSKDYIGALKYLDYICPSGHKHKIKWNDWNHGIRCGKCDIKYSKGEKEIVEYVKMNFSGIIKENDRTLIQNPKTGQYLELDIWLPNIRKAIEYNGEYWHRGIYKKWCDNYKQQWCRENNIDLLVINHDNWIKDKNYNMILKFIS